MIKTLTIEIDFDENVTDADSVGTAVDMLLESAMSTPGILDEYGNPSIGQTYILGDERNVSPLAAKRAAASKELEHKAIAYGETILARDAGTKEYPEVDQAVWDVRNAAHEYHKACCDTGDDS